MTALTIIGSLYALVVVGFLIAILLEGRKYDAEFGGIHVAVAVFWPFWLIWYLWIIIDDRRNRRK